MNLHDELRSFGLDANSLGVGSGPALVGRSPVDDSVTAELRSAAAVDVDQALARATRAFVAWRDVPAPRRGELVRLFGEELRAHMDQLARLVTLEAGKITAEARGEVQEMVDICD